MNRIKILLTLIVLGVVTSAAWAGRESGGGEVYGDSLNPWFLENTSRVSYCIEADLKNFGAQEVDLVFLVESAIAQWKEAFANARAGESINKNIEPYGMVRIATQVFSRESCGPSTMVRFQLGVLTDDQRNQFLKSPKQVIAETIRTSYDKFNLRGRGFIYVAPESGPLRPIGLAMAKHPWSFRDGLVLKRVLLHELGHLFGLSHTGSAYSLMGQNHPEYIVQQSTIERFTREPAGAIERELNRLGVFGFEFPFVQESCLSNSTILLGGLEQDQFFGFPVSSRCHKFVFSKMGFEVYSSNGVGLPYKLIGRSMSPSSIDEIQSAALRIKIDGRQQVFTMLPSQAQSSGYLDGPMVASRRVIKATYQSIDGAKSGEVKSIFLPSQLLQMDGIMNGKFIEIFE